MNQFSTNPFIAELLLHYRDVLNLVSNNHYILCVPQGASLYDSVISRQDIDTHILQPTSVSGVYRTLDRKILLA